LQQIRDEAHRFAVTFHRQRRSKRTIKTELTDIKGIGKATAQKLLQTLGSVDKIKRAEFTTLAELVGEQKAKLLRGHYNKSKNE
jgi:excinuclease ABC subunit C